MGWGIIYGVARECYGHDQNPRLSPVPHAILSIRGMRLLHKRVKDDFCVLVPAWFIFFTVDWKPFAQKPTGTELKFLNI